MSMDWMIWTIRSCSLLSKNLKAALLALQRSQQLSVKKPGHFEEVYEPFLIQEGFLQRTPRGREATEKAYRHLGKKFKGKERRRASVLVTLPAFNFLNLRSNPTNDRQGRSYAVDDNSHHCERYPNASSIIQPEL